ncbi:uncharacterized protein si:dkey-220k22.3 isoform X2 [Pygocentrus nattereri]|uniref:uncharacterized protein si:dkey-220k22.3 isoform X2 n=1 Tax=Pygocentrus nattereri TaxID=42514 RepID=UPI001890E511|nr:uncharacterized protein si:dkey-220k22.3 isoform X2 [Pygocentrus nattereri]
MQEKSRGTFVLDGSHLEQKTSRGPVISDILAARLLRVYQNASSKAQGIFKVDGFQDNFLTWEEECCVSHIILDQNKKWITVKEKGIYLIYVHVTYGLKGNGTVELRLFVNFNYTGNGGMARQETAADFDTRELTEKEQDASLSAFLLLNMRPMEQLSVHVSAKDLINYNDIRPFTNYISIIRYADW